MLNEINAENVAIVIFDGTRWEASEEDIKLLARNLLALDKRGMHELNKRLVDGGNKVWDTFAEHNFAYELISFNDFSVPILYEPNEVDGRILRRPPDFVIKKNSITFWIQMKRLSNISCSQDISFADVIDESTEQIRESLKNAVGAFVWDNDKDNINLVAMEIGSACHDLIDIGNALFGDELITHNGTWARDKNGFFYEDDFSSKVAGVIVTKRKAHLPICEYEKYLFVNERFKEQLDQIKLILSFDRIYNYYDYIGGE